MAIDSDKTSYLLVLPWDGTGNLVQLKEFYRAAFRETQHYELLLFTDIKRPKENFDIPNKIHVISKSDFNILGNLKSKKLLPTHYTHYDVCILISDLTKRQEEVVKLLKIKHVVGFNNKRDYVNINLHQSRSMPLEMVIFAREILTKISD